MVLASAVASAVPHFLAKKMELASAVPHFLKEKTILITGASGFIAKVFVEKVLRVEPNVKKLYLLIRAPNNDSATQRLHNEVIGKDLFRVLRDKWGANFGSFISKKVIAIAGDISCENLGLRDDHLRREMMEEIDYIINTAATTTFDERYDIAMAINSMGAIHVSNFAKKCCKIKLLVHVSTAYVCGEIEKEEQVVLEKPFEMGETLKGITSKLDIEVENKLLKEKIDQLQSHNADEEAIKNAMKDFGTERAKLHGWPNTYVFTKAMGEMLFVQELKNNVPLIVIRPTMVTSTFKQPFPGWIEGLRTLDTLIAAYAKGRLNCFLGHPSTILDVIPVDIVVNCMIVAMVAHSNQFSTNFIYNVATSSRNPFRASDLQYFCYNYFTKKPWINEFGKPVIVIKKVTTLTSMAKFRRYMMIRYVLPLKVLNLASRILGKHYKDVYKDNKRKLKTVFRVVELYRPYALFKGIFNDSNTKNLEKNYSKLGMDDDDEFNFDPKSIDWKDYMMNAHVSGLMKYVIKVS
ncbi:Fatty acyl-CoA reductase [Quillaja saponaria]|uniref:Fatty acyl-CoA reductase n=1 Tax=Quillaja saponaria TaxID=32244 RepID=A0AAD7PA02_QUISA|nr:Fatty acyl-CoA reductase [Quillaja saponaria]